MANVSPALGQARPVAVTPTEVFTVRQDDRTERVSITAAASDAQTITVHAVANGGTAGLATMLYDALPIPANDTFAAELMLVLMPGDRIIAESSLGTVTFTVSAKFDLRRP